MLDNIGGYILDSFKSLALGALFLFAGLWVLPDSWVVCIVKRVKSSVVRKIEEPFRKLVNTIANLYINNNMIDLQENDEIFNKNTKYYLEQNDNIDKNIYVIDLCKDIVASLSYARAGGSVYDGIFEYLDGYYNGFVPLDQEKKFIDNMTDKLLEFGEKLSNKPDSNCTRQFSDFLKKEKQKLEDLKNKNKEKMIDLIKAKINE